MYTILVTEDNKLIITTPNQRIMQRSKLVDSLHFLVAPTYNNISIKDTNVLMEYKRPSSAMYDAEFLTASEDLYKGYVEYIIPVDTNLTSESGNVEVRLTFYNVKIDTQEVRRTSSCNITITSIDEWADVTVDEAFTKIDQRIISLITANKQLSDLQQAYNDSKADDICIDGDTVYLKSNGEKIGSEQEIQMETNVIDFLKKEDVT